MQICAPRRDPTGQKSGHSRSHQGSKPLPTGNDRCSCNEGACLRRGKRKEQKEKYTYTVPVFESHRRSLSSPDCGRTPPLTQFLFIGEAYISEKHYQITLNGKNLLPCSPKCILHLLPLRGTRAPIHRNQLICFSSPSVRSVPRNNREKDLNRMSLHQSKMMDGKRILLLSGTNYYQLKETLRRTRKEALNFQHCSHYQLLVFGIFQVISVLGRP